MTTGKEQRAVLRTAMLAVILIAFSLIAVQRNRTWADPVTLWTDAASKSPRKVRPFGRLGNAYAERKQYPEALWCYERARMLEPTLSLKAYGNIGNVYIDMREYGKAVELFSMLLSINADDELSYIGRGKALYGLERYAAAREDFERAIGKNPSMARYYLYRGETYLRTGMPERGRMDIDRSCAMGWEEACDRLRELPARDEAGPAGRRP